MLAAPNVRAGSYIDTQTGGTSPATVTPAADSLSPPPEAAEEATAYSSVTPHSPDGDPTYTININPGTLTDTFTWTHGTNPDGTAQTDANDPPPACVIVEQDSWALWYVHDEWGTATASGIVNCGLPGVTGTPFTYNDPLPSAGLGVTLYSVKYSPPSPFQEMCSPTASFTGTTGTEGSVEGEADVSGMAIAYPITLTLGGTLTDSSGNPVLDSSGNQNILVGQQCTATVNGIPSYLLPYATYAWSVSGTTFQDWEPTTPAFPNATPPTPANLKASYFLGGPIPATNSTSWYWNDPANASETVSCTVTVTPPAGQGNAFTFTVSAPKPVSVQVPGWFGYGIGGYMQVNTRAPLQNGNVALYAGPSAGQNGGINWTANVMGSSLFTSGTLELVQVVTPNQSYVFNTRVGVPGATQNDPENGMFGLDTHYPYGWLTTGSYDPPYLPTLYTAYDAPSLGLGNATSATMQHQFTDYLMFKPPGYSQWVPLGTLAWSTNGSATIPATGNWADYALQNGSDSAGTVNPSTQTNFTVGNSFPSWTRVNVFPSF
jgi:hypothetical protein